MDVKFKVGDYVTPKHLGPQTAVAVINYVGRTIPPDANVPLDTTYYTINTIKASGELSSDIYHIECKELENTCKKLTEAETVLYLPR